MSMSVVQTSNGNSSVSSSNIVSASYPGAVTKGDLLICVTGSGVSNIESVLSVVDTLGNLWNLAAGPYRDATFGLSSYIWWTQAKANGANTVTVTFDSAHPYLGIVITQVNSTVPGTWVTDGIATGRGGSGPNPNVGSLSTSALNSFLIATCMNDNGPDTAGSGWSPLNNFTILYNFSTEIQRTNSLGAYTGNFVNAGSTSWCGAIAGFKIAPVVIQIGPGNIIFVGG